MNSSGIESPLTIKSILHDPEIAEIIMRNPQIERNVERAAEILIEEPHPIAVVKESIRGIINNKIDVYFSYKSKDEETARKVVEQLRVFAGEKLRITYAADFPRDAGTNWSKKIRESIKKAQWFILLLPDPSADWDWCLFETGMFRGKMVSDKVNRLFCLHHPDVQPPPQIKEFQAIKTEVVNVQSFLKMVYLDKDPIPGMDPINPHITRDLLEGIAETIADAIPTPLVHFQTIYLSERLIIDINNKDVKYEDDEILTNTTIYLQNSTLNLFGILKDTCDWKSLESKAIESGNHLWISQLKKCIHSLWKNETVATTIEAYYNDPKNKNICYRSIFNKVEYQNSFSGIRIFIILIADEKKERLLSKSDSFFGNPIELAIHPDLFMLMPFEPNIKPVFTDHIKPVAEQLGLVAKRADDFFSTGSIVHEIWSAICGAKVIVADCTDRNPNVFYEIGIAHTLGKHTILISQSTDDIPFDLRHLRIIIYRFTPRGMSEFENALESTLKSVLKIDR